jgi:curved DNA-binding protein CbpA
MSHYDTLGVSKDATRKEIQDAYRRLSKETHPDVSTHKSSANEERFKRISAAAGVLTNARKRAAYDEKISLSGPFGRGLHRDSDLASDVFGGLRPASARQQGSSHGRPTAGLPLFFHNLLRPRTFVIGSVAVLAYAGAAEYLSGPAKGAGVVREGNDRVQAWKNPETGRYEQPAPWDPLYRKLNPTLELVPRDHVMKRHR